MQTQASHRFSDVTPRKMRPLAQLVRGKTVDEAVQLLRFLPNRGAKLITGVILSARGNAIDKGARDADDMIWAGNLALLMHEQRVVVQPLFELLSGTFARLVSMGSTTSFEVRGLRQEVRYFTSFSAFSLVRGLNTSLRTRTVPSMARFDDRWRWLEVSVVPRFRRLDADKGLLDRTLGRVVEEAKRYADKPCVVPT